MNGKTIAAITDRVALRETLARHKLRQPRHGVIHSPEDLRRVVQTIPPPWALLPAAHPRGMAERRVDHPEDLPLALGQITRAAGTGPAILEEYFIGPAVSIFLAASGNGFTTLGSVGHRHSEDGRYRFPRALEVPTAMPSAELDQCAAKSLRALTAIELVRGVARVDVVLHQGQPVVLAIESPPVTWPVDILKAAGAGDISQAILATAANDPIPATSSPSRAAVVQWFTAHTGRVLAVEGLEEARALPGVVEIEIPLKPGDVLPHCIDEITRNMRGHAVVTGADLEEARQRAAAATSACRIVTSNID